MVSTSSAGRRSPLVHPLAIARPERAPIDAVLLLRARRGGIPARRGDREGPAAPGALRWAGGPGRSRAARANAARGSHGHESLLLRIGRAARARGGRVLIARVGLLVHGNAPFLCVM